MQAIDEIVPTLLHALEDDDMADTALDGLKQILRYHLEVKNGWVGKRVKRDLVGTTQNAFVHFSVITVVLLYSSCYALNEY